MNERDKKKKKRTKTTKNKDDNEMRRKGRKTTKIIMLSCHLCDEDEEEDENDDEVNAMAPISNCNTCSNKESIEMLSSDSEMLSASAGAPPGPTMGCLAMVPLLMAAASRRRWKRRSRWFWVRFSWRMGEGGWEKGDK